MKLKFPVLIFASLLAVTFYHAANAQTLPRAEIPGTQVLTYTSSVVAGQEYQLFINLPRNYARDTTKAYPVLYLLDGQYDFPLFTGIYGNQYYDGFVPEVITVGITWGGKNPDAGVLRGRDFTPTEIKQMPSGGGPRFLAFIKTELIPFIKSKYRVTDDRTLTGSSYGGLFTLYALYTEPSLFRRYILTSPATDWDKAVLRTWETKYEATGSASPTRLFMGRGELEDPNPEFQKLADRLKKVKNLEVYTTIFANTGHAGTKPEGYSRGLQWVFKRPSIQLAPAILSKYAGAYTLGNDTVHLAAKNGALVAVSKFNDFVLQAESENSFYHDGAYLKGHFEMDKAGKVTGFALEQFNGAVFYKRVK